LRPASERAAPGARAKAAPGRTPGSSIAGPTQGAFKDVATVNPNLAWGAAMVLLVLGIVGLYLKRTNAESHATLVTVYARQARKFGRHVEDFAEEIASYGDFDCV
jgi:hypothetical protein